MQYTLANADEILYFNSKGFKMLDKIHSLYYIAL
jgi:hypothetical protein